MKILVINAGSSSLKFQLINMPMNEDQEQPVVLIEGGFERIASNRSPPKKSKSPNPSAQIAENRSETPFLQAFRSAIRCSVRL